MSSKGEKLTQKQKGVMPRILVVAIISALIIPGLGQLYNGQPKKGIVFFLSNFVLALLFGLLGFSSNQLALIILLAVSLTLNLYFIIDTVIQFKSCKNSYRSRNKRYYYLYYSIVVLFFIIFGLFEFTPIPNHKTFKVATTSMSPTLKNGDVFGVSTSESTLADIKRGDLLTFRAPEGDTICLNMPYLNYYILVRQYGRKAVLQDKIAGDILVKSIDEKEAYIKRCIGKPGDEIKITNSQLFINGKGQGLFKDVQYNYFIATDEQAINSKFIDKHNISKEDFNNAQLFRHSQDDINFIRNNEELKDYNIANLYIIPLTKEKANHIRKNSFIKSVVRYVKPEGQYNEGVFPHNPKKYTWNEDNFGPLLIPQAGVKIELNASNIYLYKRAIQIYEKNELAINGDEIFINGELVDSYTFKMNYYWLMGDNRHNSADSRFWGFVPEDHVVGKALMVWFSSDKDKSFPANIRWDRLLTMIH